MRTLTKTAAVAGLAAMLLAGCGSGNGSNDKAANAVLAADKTNDGNGPTIVVGGEGKVEGTPDTATVTLGVQTHDPSAQGALQRNNSEAAALIATLKSKGVAEKDIQTTDLSIYPDFDKNGHITGYSVSNTVTVKLHDISKAGATIDAAAAAVGNDVRMQGVALSIENTSALVAKARADAVKDALAQGRQLSAAAGVRLGAIRTIDDTGADVPQPLYDSGLQANRALADAAVPIQAGTQKLAVDVKVVFDIAS